MATFKCKICGGALELDSAQSVATCEYCGTKQTLPKLDDDRKANLYDRANHFRRNNDFDKALSIYEQILNEDSTDAESYWSIVLCRYGIEYVEDPATHKRVPTVNRAQFTSVFDDEDYKSALQYADGYQREIYESEAAAINEIQKGILAISQKEEPFDVFICYKETDSKGRRTQDSVLATELYHELTREGFKVFFARITLEDKLGIAYEPYIFAALHSAKVMVVLGTCPEHFNAVWVKNEWSRFLALIKNGAKKTLIPAYRDMGPYDLPEEFSHLQAQDMSKLGFMQDLTRGIKKIVGVDAPTATVQESVVTSAAPNTAPLLKRAFMFLEDGEFDRADGFCEQVLNQDPENARAYLGKLMAELRVKRPSDLENCAEPFDNNKNYQKAIRFADATLAAELKGYVASIKERNARKAEEARKESLYLRAMDYYKSYDVARLQSAIKVFTSLTSYKDSAERVRLCQAKIDQIHIKEENDRIEYERLAEQKRIADEQARLEKQRQAEIRRIKAQKRAKRNKKIAMVAAPLVLMLVAFVILLNTVIIPNRRYNNALSLKKDGKYNEAITLFEELNEYKDSQKQIIDCLLLEGKFGSAKNLINRYSLTELNIPDGVQSIDDSAFRGCSSITSVTIPNSVTSIGSFAFEGCSSLTSITIPNSVTSIGDSAFEDCSGLTSIIIPDSVISVGFSAFFGCSGLTNMTLPFVGASESDRTYTYLGYIFGTRNYEYSNDCVPSSLKTVVVTGGTSIGHFAFSGCSNLTSITIPDGVTSIGASAFANCSNLTSITIPDGVTSIRSSTFAGCSNLSSITIPDSVTGIGSSAFANCSNLTSITIPDSVTRVGYYAFADCFNLSCITILGGVTYISDYVFSGCSSLTGIAIPDSVTIIGACAFEGCSGLTSVTIPDSVTSIGTSAFADCSNLSSITIPDSVTYIGNSAFAGCSGLTSMTLPFVGAIKDGLDDTHFGYLFSATSDIYNSGCVPSGLKTVVITGGTIIDDYAFWGCSGLTSVTIPDSVTSIGTSAFAGCSGLTSVTIPDGVTSIGSSAFANCSNLSNITIPDSVTSISDYAFKGCSNLTSVTIPDSVTSIGTSAFYYCRNLTIIHFQSTKSQWNAIKKGSFWDENTGAYTVRCTDGDIAS